MSSPADRGRKNKMKQASEIFSRKLSETDCELRSDESTIKSYEQLKTRCKLVFFIENSTRFTTEPWRSPSSLPHLIEKKN
jgi:hypothetical protein